MKLEVYIEATRMLLKCKSREELAEVAERLPGVSIKTLGSIYSQEYQKKIKRTHHLFSTPESIAKFYDSFLTKAKNKESHIIVKMAEEVDFSPVLLGKIILEKHLAEMEYGGENPPKSLLTQLMKEPLQMGDHVMAKEIQECIASDEHYGALADSIKHSVGFEYEFKLKKTLDSLDLTYMAEEQMRKSGYDKTPDIKLEVPIVDGYPVNWIESKASFGDAVSHNAYLKYQYWSYWNRFGPGMVLYWFGFIDELDINRDKGIILKDYFPENIVKFNPFI